MTSDKLLEALVGFYSEALDTMPRMDEFQELAREDYDEIEFFIDSTNPAQRARKLRQELYDFVYGVNNYKYDFFVRR